MQRFACAVPQPPFYLPPHPMPNVASYCTTFLKPEMLHIYRQITGLQRWQTVVLTKERQSAERFPMPAGRLEVIPKGKKNFLRRFWLKYIKRAPAIVYRGEYRALEQVLRRHTVDVLHVYFGHTGVHLLPFLQHWDKPSIVSFHGMDIQPRKEDPTYVDRLKQVLQTATLVLARSESLQQKLLAYGCPAEKLRLNRTSIPLDQFPIHAREIPTDGAWRLVQACRLIDKKGLDDALHAFAEFVKLAPSAHFTIAGEGPLLDSLTQLRDQLGLQQHVTFTGFLSGADLVRVYQESHVFVHPSRVTADGNMEGIPNSMIEAMCTGLPVVATLHGGIPEAVKHGLTGLLVPERSVPELFQALQQLLLSPGMWQQFSSAAAADMRAQFALERNIAALEACYDEAVQVHAAKAAKNNKS
jgi:colanic acid/amylovoran biosynthesis glycosyltransferase